MGATTFGSTEVNQCHKKATQCYKCYAVKFYALLCHTSHRVFSFFRLPVPPLSRAAHFSVVGPSTCNGLPSQLRIFPRALSPAFFSHLRTVLFSRAGAGSDHE